MQLLRKMINDTHAHLDFIKDLDKLIANAKKNNVKTIITNSVNLNSLDKSLEIKKKYPEIVALAVGLYPEETLESNHFDKLLTFVKDNTSSIIALGEIGLDFSRELPKKEIQKEVFINELNLARELKLPVIIHTRKAEKEVLEILKDYKDLKIILHCFSGNFKLVEKAIELDCYFSIPTNIVRAEHFQKLVEKVPREKILTETDSPYLSPFKEKENEPAFITETIKKISEIWKIDKDKIEKILETNFNRVFSEQ